MPQVGHSSVKQYHTYMWALVPEGYTEGTAVNCCVIFQGKNIMTCKTWDRLYQFDLTSTDVNRDRWQLATSSHCTNIRPEYPASEGCHLALVNSFRARVCAVVTRKQKTTVSYSPWLNMTGHRFTELNCQSWYLTLFLKQQWIHETKLIGNCYTSIHNGMKRTTYYIKWLKSSLGGKKRKMFKE